MFASSFRVENSCRRQLCGPNSLYEQGEPYFLHRFVLLQLAVESLSCLHNRAQVCSAPHPVSILRLPADTALGPAPFWSAWNSSVRPCIVAIMWCFALLRFVGGKFENVGLFAKRGRVVTTTE